MRYFDHNATSPLSDAARAAWLEAQASAWVNPGSPTRTAARVRLQVQAARERLGALLGLDPAGFVFTSGATEASTGFFRAIAEAMPGGNVIIGAGEHPAVGEAAEESYPGGVSKIPLDQGGRASLEGLGALLAKSPPALVSLQLANNETGVLQPWREAAEICERAGVPFLCDVTQGLGRLPAEGFSQCTALFASGHKTGAPKGIGFLWTQPNERKFALQPGGGQQNGRRGGTEDYPAVAALVAAVEEAGERREESLRQQTPAREALIQRLAGVMPGMRVIGAVHPRLWNTLGMVLPGPTHERWVAALESRGFLIATGAACATGREAPSHVLAAMGMSGSEARRYVRVSSGFTTTAEDWEALAEAFVEVWGAFQQEAVTGMVIDPEAF